MESTSKQTIVRHYYIFEIDHFSIYLELQGVKTKKYQYAVKEKETLLHLPSNHYITSEGIEIHAMHFSRMFTSVD